MKTTWWILWVVALANRPALAAPVQQAATARTAKKSVIQRVVTMQASDWGPLLRSGIHRIGARLPRPLRNMFRATKARLVAIPIQRKRFAARIGLGAGATAALAAGAATLVQGGDPHLGLGMLGCGGNLALAATSRRRAWQDGAVGRTIAGQVATSVVVGAGAAFIPNATRGPTALEGMDGILGYTTAFLGTAFHTMEAHPPRPTRQQSR